MRKEKLLLFLLTYEATSERNNLRCVKRKNISEPYLKTLGLLEHIEKNFMIFQPFPSPVMNCLSPQFCQF